MSRPVIRGLLLASSVLWACAPPADPADPPGAREVIRAGTGGAVSFGDATLSIPAGSLARDTQIGIAALEALPASEARRFVPAGQAYELTPHGTEFALAAPAVLRVAVDRAAMAAKGLDASTTQLFYFDDTLGAYMIVASAFDDRTGTLVAAIEHFSKYVVMAQAAADAATGPTVAMQGTVPATIRAGAPIYLRATVVPSPGTAIAAVRVFYKKLSATPQPLIQAVMTPDNTPTMPGSNTYGFLIPAAFLSAADTGLVYYAEATDSLGVTTTLAATPVQRDVTLSYVPGSLAVAPAALTISAGFERWLTVSGTDSAASAFSFIPESVAVSTCPGPSGLPIGEVDDQRASGVHFRARQACAGTLTISAGAEAASIPVTIGIGHLASITLFRYEQVGAAEIRTPFDGAYSLSEGRTLDLDALGFDAFGNTASVNVTWSADPAIGTIDGRGRLYTLDGAGTGQVRASVGGIGGVTAAQWFHVTGRSWGDVGSALAANPLSGWTPAVAMGTPRAYQTATLLPSGKVLVAGGYDGTSTVTSAELYDPEANAWSPAGAMGTARYLHTTTLLPTGKVLVAGGSVTINGAVSSAELYDPATNAWSPAGSMTGARYQHTATMLPSGQVLVTGGFAVPAPIFGAQLTAELYHPGTNGWLPAASMAGARYRHAATLLPSGKVLVTGGLTNGSISSATTEIYDPAVNAWTSAAAMLTPRVDHTATLLPSGKVLVIGGRNGTTNLATTELYDPATNAWTPASAMAVARYAHTATLLPSGWVQVSGGYSSSGAVAIAELYDPATNTWMSVRAMGIGRSSHTATLLPKGRVLVTGGLSAATLATAVASTERFFAFVPAVEPSLAFAGSTPYVAWHEADAVTHRVFVKRWSGSSWDPIGAALNVDPTREATAPRIALAGDVPFVAWQEPSADVSQIYVKRWDGVQWTQDGTGSLNVDRTRNARAATIAAAGTTPYVAWEEQGPGARQVFVRRFTGTSWAQLGGNLATSPMLDASHASIAVTGGTPYVAWEQQMAAGTHTIVVAHWTGVAWAPDGPGPQVDPAADVREPMIALAGGVPYVTWRERLGAATRVYVAHWTGTGWLLDGTSLNDDPSRPVFSPAIGFASAAPGIATPYVAWRESIGGLFQLHVKHWNGTAWIARGDLLPGTGVSSFAPAIGFDGITPHIAWAEIAGPSYAIRVQRLQ